MAKFISNCGLHSLDGSSQLMGKFRRTNDGKKRITFLTHRWHYLRSDNWTQRYSGGGGFHSSTTSVWGIITYQTLTRALLHLQEALTRDKTTLPHLCGSKIEMWKTTPHPAKIITRPLYYNLDFNLLHFFPPTSLRRTAEKPTRKTTLKTCCSLTI